MIMTNFTAPDFFRCYNVYGLRGWGGVFMTEWSLAFSKSMLD